MIFISVRHSTAQKWSALVQSLSVFFSHQTVFFRALLPKLSTCYSCVLLRIQFTLWVNLSTCNLGDSLSVTALWLTSPKESELTALPSHMSRTFPFGKCIRRTLWQTASKVLLLRCIYFQYKKMQESIMYHHLKKSNESFLAAINWLLFCTNFNVHISPDKRRKHFKIFGNKLIISMITRKNWLLCILPYTVSKTHFRVFAYIFPSGLDLYCRSMLPSCNFVTFLINSFIAAVVFITMYILLRC